MMGRREDEQGQFFYSFDLDKVVPPNHLVRQIDGLLDLSWVHKELVPYYSHTGRPSIDPVLMIDADRWLRVCAPLGAPAMR
jgi:transposase